MALVAITILAIILRSLFLGYFPPALNWDEVSHGYNAYGLLQTGRDEWGQTLPVIFRAYGDYKLPTYVYMVVPALAMGGLQDWLIRSVSWVAGIILVPVTYILVRRSFSQTISLASATLVAVSPWTWWLSRGAFEANLALLFISVGVCLLTRNKVTRGVLFLGLAMWTYNSARIFSPMLLLAYWLGNRKVIKISPVTVTVTAILFLPVFWQLLSPVGQARYRWLSLLDEGAINTINSLRTFPASQFIFNKVTYFGYKFVANYLSYLGPKFLFISGGDHYQFSLPNYGLLSLVNLPLYLIGLFYLLKTRRWFWLVWLLLAPIPGSLTKDSPHVLRAIPLIPIPMLASAIGLQIVTNKYKYATVGYAAFLTMSIVNYQLLIGNYTKSHSWSWQYGYRQVIQLVKQRYTNYDEIIFTKRYGEPHEFVAWYHQWNPAIFAQLKQWDYHANWFWVNQLDKYRFVNDWELVEIVSQLPRAKNYLIISSPENSVPGVRLEQINFLDGRPAFIINHYAT